MTEPFKDHFSGHAATYAEYRPTYPEALFDWLAEISPARNLALDCGTGNGQAAIPLAARFARVIATDPSEPQIRNARRAPNIEYRVAAAERSGLEPDSADLVTVAQALHWIDREAFFVEAARVLRPNGVIAVWCYQLLRVSPAIDQVVNAFEARHVGKYWPPERVLVDTGYRSVPFPFSEFEPAPFSMTEAWNLAQLVGYLGTWSAVQRYRKTMGNDPIELILPDLTAAWGDPAERQVIEWPLQIRVGRKS